jgi:hypothetical protein
VKVAKEGPAVPPVLGGEVAPAQRRLARCPPRSQKKEEEKGKLKRRAAEAGSLEAGGVPGNI